MKPFFESTKVIIHGTKDFPVWISFSEMDRNAYVNSAAEEIAAPYEVFFVVNNGTVRVAWDNKYINVGAGQGVMIKKGTETKILLASHESASFYSLIFDEKYILDKGELYEKYAREFLNNPEISVVGIDSKDLHGETILEDVNRVIAMNLAHKSGYELITKGILCHLWLYVLEYTLGNVFESADNSLESRDDRRVKAACEYIAEHYGDIVTLGDIASYINLSEGECCRSFERVIFTSPIEYLMKYRIYSAVKILLKKPASIESISELSFITGFNSPGYFNRVFKKYVLCTPSEYRKIIKTDIEQAEKIYTSIQEEITIL